MAEYIALRSSHLSPEMSLQLLGVTPTAHWLECADWWNVIMSEPLRIERGLAIPGRGDRRGSEWMRKASAGVQPEAGGRAAANFHG
jgi:hypothetical protein